MHVIPIKDYSAHFFVAYFALPVLQFSFPQGGGWCNNVSTCLNRKSTRLGSSTKMAKEIEFSGLLSNKEKFNPGWTFYSLSSRFMQSYMMPVIAFDWLLVFSSEFASIR